MNTNDPNILKAVRSKKLFQIEVIDRISPDHNTRDQFIAFILKDQKALGGVKFAITPFRVNYRYTMVKDANGIESQPPLYRYIGVHFNIQVTEFDNHLKTFLHKIRKGSEVFFTVTINQDDDNINSLGLERHLLTGRIGSDTYLIATWVGTPDKSPVRYPRPVHPNNLLNSSDRSQSSIASKLSSYSNN